MIQPPPSRKRKTKFPCTDCGLRPDLCLCDEIPTLSLKTRLTLIIHYKELKRTTNTGRLAIKALSNSEMVVRGRPEAPVDLSDFIQPQLQTLLLYPADDAVALTPDMIGDKPVQLLVPDGNWRQASKVHYRHKELQGIPRVFVNKKGTELDQLRSESKVLGLPTLLAIAQALQVLEGDTVYQKLLELLKLKIARTLDARGQIS